MAATRAGEARKIRSLLLMTRPKGAAARGWRERRTLPRAQRIRGTSCACWRVTMAPRDGATRRVFLLGDSEVTRTSVEDSEEAAPGYAV